MAGAELRVITGPTAAGKSALALALAERHGAAIVSADSRQIYRGFDVGTAKPGEAERALAPHYGIDVIEPTERYSAARWADDAERWIAAARASGREPVIVGGTGFYLRALFAPLFAEPALDPERRHALERALAPLATGELRRWCERLDPARAALGRTQLLRAIEVALLTGRRLSDLHAQPTRAPRFRARYLVVDPGAHLAGRIERRVDEMLASGWLDEVRSLVKRVPGDAPAWNAAGYAVVRELVEGAIALPAARERVVIETRQYAKRQRTWMRHQLDAARVTRLDPGDPDAMEKAERWWNGATG
ncbi:MAG TPA: tRNA (adenosine(37)-N6)-dimethylallyltransferase MiaA [Gemmatimonadaceae bacterium]|nr:tRNA (adenosine(37)-N6)-dimethylallyltransferase MiaA [Gemmatimonadaceae bacterium]